MIRYFGLTILLIVSALFAETQQEAYYRAMKAEEAGDIPAALKAFQEAVALPGPYTEELQEIIREYSEALGDSSDSNSVEPWEFHVSGELGLFGMHYKETGMDEGEMGGDIFLNVNPYWDYVSGTWAHTFALSVQGDYFLNNDEMSVLDTNDWNLSFGLEYTLMGKSMLLDAGYDFNMEGDNYSSDFYAWFEKDFHRFEKQRIGAVAWAYYQTSGPMSYSLYGAWHRTVAEGFNGTVYAGVKFEADSVYDYKGYIESYKAAMSAYETAEDGNEAEAVEESAEDVVITKSFGKFIGPVLRCRGSYKFKNRLQVEAKMNLFYGIAVGGPDSDYEKIKKLNGTVGLTASWKYWKMNYYLGLERNFRYYSLPSFYEKFYKERTALTQIKLGVKWDI